MRSVVDELRDMVPLRPLAPTEALRVAELQATRLLALSGVSEPAVPESIVTELPRIQVEKISQLPVSGLAHWAKGRWVLALNGTEPYVRNRFTIFHEFHHILMHPFIEYAYQPLRGTTEHAWAEQCADHFAACALMPRAWVKRSWGDGIQDPAQLARLFVVSQAAMRFRLSGIGLSQPTARCPVPEAA